jgi:hypothetical protein
LARKSLICIFQTPEKAKGLSYKPMEGNNLYLLFPRQKKSKYQCIMFQTPNRTETDQELHEPEPHMN